MSEKRRDNIDDQIRVYRGVIPWSVVEYDWVIATFDERRPKEENLPLTEEFAEYKQEFDAAHGEDLENFKDMILFSYIFHQRYPKKIEYDAHSYRFNQINNFLITHEDELFQLKLIYVNDEKKYVDQQLMKALCTMMYDEEDFDELGEWIGNTFSYEDVIAQTKAKINKKSGNKPLTEDQGFRGMIPWSRAEFKWIMDQQMVRRKESNENHEHKDQLIKEGLVDNASGELAMEPELIESLCILPYSLRQAEKAADKKHAFLYKEVVAKAKALRSVRLN